MKKFMTLAVALGLAFSTTAFAQKQSHLRIQNPSAFGRQELVRIPFAKFQHHFGLKAQDTVFTLLDQAKGQQVNYQLEKLGKETAQFVLIEVHLAAKGALDVALKAGAPAAIASKAYARYVPERKDDFAWENDKAAFRAYGKALEGTSEDAQGFDFWAKRTDELIINDWYKTGDYHKDHGKGLDYYSVGQTLGVGDLAFYFGDKVQYSKHYRQFEVLDNGPLRTTFKLIFEPEDIAGNRIAIEKTISLDAGSQFNKIDVVVTADRATTIPVVVGIAKRKEESPIFQWDAKKGTFAYWEPAHDDNITGTGLVLPKGATKLADAEKQFLFKLNVKNKTAFQYYAGAAFNKAGRIQSAAAWNQHLAEEYERIEKPLQVNYIK